MNALRGWYGEKKTMFRMWLFLDKNVYRKFHNVIIPAKNGTAQIDHILVSPYGLFIVETKNKKGWIFGSENQSKWTQVLYSNKYSFQNPLRQTFRQKKVLAEYLELHESTIHTVILFVGDCKFKSQLPTNVIKSQLSKYIKQFKNQLLTPEKIDQVVDKLKKHITLSSLTTRDHIRSLRDRHSSTSICPKCGSNLVERKTKEGSRFLGCENYPRCRFTRSV